jgi:glycosyltransferase involved in cell wall biosynthesis
MKILVFYPYIPWPLDRGTFQRTFHLLRELARDNEVDLFALAENSEGTEHREIFRQFCRRVEFFPFKHPAWQKLFPDRLLNPLPTHVAHWTIPGVAEKLDALLAAEKYDAVHLCDIILAPYFMGKHREMPIVIDRSRVDLFYQLMEHSRLKFPLRDRVLRCEGYLKLWFFERAVAKRAALEIVCGEDDEKFLKRTISPRMPVETLVNGVDLEYFFPASSNEPRHEKPTVLFCGAMDYNPNIDALRWYFSEVHGPLRVQVPDLKVLIVGKNPTEEVKHYSQMTEVEVTGGVPDVRPFYRQAWLQMVPLRIGGGSRLKIVESLAMGTPVVSTTIGAQGLGLVHNNDVLLADTATDFAREIARALGDESLRKKLKETGLETVCSRLSWPTLGRQLCGFYTKRFAAPQTIPGQWKAEKVSG